MILKDDVGDLIVVFLSGDIGKVSFGLSLSLFQYSKFSSGVLLLLGLVTVSCQKIKKNRGVF